MNPQRSYYFLRQKEEQLEESAKEQNIKAKELEFRELVNRETIKLVQIKHETQVENLHHEIRIDRKLYEEEVNMLNILHDNEKISIGINHKQELYKTDRELQHSQHLNHFLEHKNGILKEQNVLESKRGQLKEEKYQMLQKMNEHREEYIEKSYDLKEREAELGQSNHMLKINAGVFKAQQERANAKLENWEGELFQRSYSQEVREERQLLEVEYRNKEADLKEAILEKNRKMHLTVYKSEKERLKFWTQVSDVLEVRNEAIEDFLHYDERAKQLKVESDDVFKRNLNLKFEMENRRKKLKEGGD